MCVYMGLPEYEGSLIFSLITTGAFTDRPQQPVVEVKKGHTAVFHTVITASEIICYGVDGLTFRNHGGELL